MEKDVLFLNRHPVFCFHTCQILCFNIEETALRCLVTDGSALTFDLQLQGVGEVPLGVGHVTFVHSRDIPCDGGQRQGTIENLGRVGGRR